MMLVNRVRQERERRGWSQGELAERIGVSRPTVRLVEEEKVVPSTLVALRLAAVFHLRVEELFRDSANSVGQCAIATDDGIRVGDTVILTTSPVGLVAHPYRMTGGSAVLPQLLGRVTDSANEGKVQVEASPYRRPLDAVAIAGCDPALQLIAESSQTVGAAVFWRNEDNAHAAQLLRRGLVQAAAVHLPPGESADALMEGLDVAIEKIHFASWDLGWLLRRGNPTGFRGVRDLANDRFRVVNRKPGAGTRRVLDRLLTDAGINPLDVSGYSWEVDSHYEVGWAIQNGLADVGLAVSSVSRPLSLDFLPISREQCQLWIAKDELSRRVVGDIFSQLSTSAFRWDLSTYGDYDVSRTGQLL